MKEDFDFNRIGKRLPYTTPDSFLDDIENNVWETVKQEMQPSGPKRNFRHLVFCNGRTCGSKYCTINCLQPIAPSSKD